MKKMYANRTPVAEPWERAHYDQVRQITAQGMVLLENNGALPLKKGTRVALYGYGARRTAYCGYGAASINSRNWTSIEQGLLQAGLIVSTGDYLDRYDAAIDEEEEAYFREIRAVGGTLFDRLVKMYSTQFTPVCQIPITMSDVERSNTDLAIFVITRVSGEGADRKPIAGDYMLSEGEERNLLFLSEHYKTVIVLLNTVGVIDTRFLRELPNLGALVFCGLNGAVTGSATADFLLGKVTPEGKLTATWAERYEDYPNANTFGLMDADVDDEYYTEGIYLGYRFFDSFGIQPAYPFGHGLSYTDFSIETENASIEKEKIHLKIRIKNCGTTYSGREVVQLYVSCPSVELPQPAQCLAAFSKTKLLAPGQSQQIELWVRITDLASYCEKSSSWILEAGDYILRVGNSSRKTMPVAIVRIDHRVVVERCRPFDSVCTPMKELCPPPNVGLFADEQLPDTLAVLTWSSQLQTIVHDYGRRKREESCFRDEAFLQANAKKMWQFPQLLHRECTPEEFAASLSQEELIRVCVGNVSDSKDATDGGMLVCASEDLGSELGGETPFELVVGASYTTSALIESRKLPNTAMADGGCGIRLLPEFEIDSNGNLIGSGISAIKNGGRLMNEKEKAFFLNVPRGEHFWQYTTPLSMSVILAQTWDLDAWEQTGELEQREMQRFGLKLWLAPGMNLHRNPLCGRNFEYYSEDPLLTGQCAAAVISGIQSDGHCGATIKHIACNNQEENRGGMNAHITERALREIYLKGYEIAVRREKPMAMMTGHNLINGVNAAESYDILTTAAREEWGFDGLVMTDWGTTAKSDGQKRKYGPSDCDKCLKAGTDLIMPGSVADQEELRTALCEKRLDVTTLRWCATNILRVLEKLWNVKK